MRLDAERTTVTVSAGLTYAELAPRLHAAGYALRNLGSLPHISIAGTCATGTHGSGNANGILATAVSALEMITAEGDALTLSRDGDGDQFCGAVVGLGALGIVTSLSLDIVPAFHVRQYVYEHLPREQLDEHLADILASAYSVSVFTDWRSSPIIRVWLKELVDGGGSPEPARQWYGARPADGPRHPVPGLPAVNCTQQMGAPGPWHERLPHFRPDFTPSVGDELQSEYLMPRQSAVSALRALDSIWDQLAPVLQVAEIRTVAADELWMSPSYQQDSVAFHFSWINDVPVVIPVLAGIEAKLTPFGARPHGERSSAPARRSSAGGTGGCPTSGGCSATSTQPASSATSWSMPTFRRAASACPQLPAGVAAACAARSPGSAWRSDSCQPGSGPSPAAAQASWPSTL